MLWAWHHACKVSHTYWTFHNDLCINREIMLCPMLISHSDLSLHYTTVIIQSNSTKDWTQSVGICTLKELAGTLSKKLFGASSKIYICKVWHCWTKGISGHKNILCTITAFTDGQMNVTTDKPPREIYAASALSPVYPTIDPGIT